MLGRAVARLETQGSAGGDQGDRQVAVDVRVHARDRELERRDLAARAALEEGAPGARRLPRVPLERRAGLEEEVGEAQVERLDERAVLERACVELGGNTLGHLAVEARK